MSDVITDVAMVTPEWLTALLHREGVLAAGVVTQVTANTTEGNTAFLSNLHLTYSDDAPAEAPTHLFLKTSKPIEWAMQECRDEVAFYNTVRGMAPPVPSIIHCYDAAYSKETHLSHLILDDVSETNYTPVTVQQAKEGNNVPSDMALSQMVHCIANFHAYWWEHPRLGEGIAQFHYWFQDDETFATLVARRKKEYDSFLGEVGDKVPREWLDICDHAIWRLHLLRDRYYRDRLDNRRNITLTNGDCYFNQFLCPYDPLEGSTYLIDFQSTCTFVPASDLSFMFASFWTPEQRHERDREKRLLKRYHNALLMHGIESYSFDDLMQDYRLSIIYLLFESIWHQTNRSSEAYWRKKLGCVIGAYSDLNCAELLD